MRQICVLEWEEIKTHNSGETHHELMNPLTDLTKIDRVTEMLLAWYKSSKLSSQTFIPGKAEFPS